MSMRIGLFAKHDVPVLYQSAYIGVQDAPLSLLSLPAVSTSGPVPQKPSLRIFSQRVVRETPSGTALASFAAGLPYRFLNMEAFCAFTRFGEPCDAFSWVVEQGLFREDRLSQEAAARQLTGRPRVPADSAARGYFPANRGRAMPLSLRMSVKMSVIGDRRSGELRKVVLGKGNDVLTPGPQRRDMELDHIQPVVEIGPETSFRHEPGQVGIA